MSKPIGMTLTHKQAELLRFIKAHIRANDGVAPSFDEMKAALNLVSKSGIHRLLTGLEERGYIYRPFAKARAITVLEQSPPSSPTPTIAAADWHTCLLKECGAIGRMWRRSGHE